MTFLTLRTSISGLKSEFKRPIFMPFSPQLLNGITNFLCENGIRNIHLFSIFWYINNIFMWQKNAVIILIFKSKWAEFSVVFHEFQLILRFCLALFERNSKNKHRKFFAIVCLERSLDMQSNDITSNLIGCKKTPSSTTSNRTSQSKNANFVAQRSTVHRLYT